MAISTHPKNRKPTPPPPIPKLKSKNSTISISKFTDPWLLRSPGRARTPPSNFDLLCTSFQLPISLCADDGADFAGASSPKLPHNLVHRSSLLRRILLSTSVIRAWSSTLSFTVRHHWPLPDTHDRNFRHDKARGVEIGNKDVKLEFVEDAYTTSNWIKSLFSNCRHHHSVVSSRLMTGQSGGPPTTSDYRNLATISISYSLFLCCSSE